jgi:hypothetical protein
MHNWRGWWWYTNKRKRFWRSLKPFGYRDRLCCPKWITISGKRWLRQFPFTLVLLPPPSNTSLATLCFPYRKGALKELFITSFHLTKSFLPKIEIFCIRESRLYFATDYYDTRLLRNENEEPDEHHRHLTTIIVYKECRL